MHIEQLHNYLEQDVLPARPQLTFPTDFNIQLQASLAIAEPAQEAVPWACVPTDRIAADGAAMLALPPVPPTTVAEKTSLRLPPGSAVSG